jgi:hypothetical protein
MHLHSRDALRCLSLTNSPRRIRGATAGSMFPDVAARHFCNFSQIISAVAQRGEQTVPSVACSLRLDQCPHSPRWRVTDRHWPW